MDVPDKRNNIDCRGIARIAQKVHEDINDVGGDFGELDGARVDALDEELAIFEVLHVSAQEPLVASLSHAIKAIRGPLEPKDVGVILAILAFPLPIPTDTHSARPWDYPQH